MHSHGARSRRGRLQLIVGPTLERRYDSTILGTFLVAAPYPLAYWLIAAAAALRAETIALLRGPRRQRVVWTSTRDGSKPRPEP